MSNWRVPNRSQLAKFLPDPESIKAFEELFKTVEVEYPEFTEEVLNLILTAGRQDAATVNIQTQIQQLTDMIGSVRREFASELFAIRGEIDSLKMGNSRLNISDIENRLKTLEEYTAGIR